MSPSSRERPLLLVLSTGKQELREYLLASIATRYRVHIVSALDPRWEQPYVAGWTRLADTQDVDAVIAAGRAVHRTDPIAGVVCWDETRILQAAALAGALGLPGGDVEVIGRCRDKHRTRRALAAAGVPQPESVPAATLDAALRAAEGIGYPVVVKPSDLALSLGVVIVHTPDELAEAFAETSAIRVPELPDYRVRVLVEEYVAGAEISVDTAMHRGRAFPLVIARKQVGYPPYAVEIGHYVDPADPLLADTTLARVLRDTHRALGCTDGVTHTELKLTPDGPKVIEVNGRLGGDLIPYLGLCSRGVDTGLAAAAVACGEPPHTEVLEHAFAGVRFCYPEQRTEITDIRFEQSALHPATDRYGTLVGPGSIAPPPPEGILTGRIAYLTAVSQTLPECLAALDRGAAALQLNGAPVQQAGSRHGGGDTELVGGAGP